MKCPFCENEDTQVKDSRPSEENSAIRRRRECNNCDARFTTFERIQLRELNIIKSDGSKEIFKREKLLRSMKISLQKRLITEDVIERHASNIVRQLETSGETDIASKKIGELVMEVLSNLDPVAYIRYASVYKDFREVNDFNTFLDDLDNKYKKEQNA